ncbi:site-specific DNA-methyltransferase [Pseudomonas aeruginosa]|uniref:site-specific DNA-methyltransferase n=1 Tax=Pseudomonas aeruginosa TaxID=287 RepID=UPI001431DFC3|nr:site-specific DNA-methyltransferase [Pseudomonas aeruginosa]MDG4458299.1 site-specific DNA-methyltransferase [Pseudomonas aeruginosa]NJC77040.1 site-specific DNA-methyltransferase [Pseudomonas aeruginosa]
MEKLTAASLEAQSADLVAGNIEQLKTLFPELLTEGKDGVAVNVDVLKALVGDASVTDADEKYGLNWHGKRRARQLALTPSTGTLRPCPEDSVDWETTQNLMIEGDNLEVLKLLQKSYAGKVKLIYIDPPYNTGKDFVYPDNFQDNIKNYLELTGQIEGGQKISSNTEASGRFHTDWLNMMYSRIKVAKNLLKLNDTLCVSLSDVELPNFRLLADEIFGEENFIAVISWEKVHTRKNSAQTFSVSHDYVIVYARDIAAWDRSLLPREGPSAYKNPDNDPKGPWKPDPVTAHNPYSADYKITKPNGVLLSRPIGRYWAFSESTWNEKVKAGEVLWGDSDSYPMIKRYLSEVQDGLVPITIFSREFAGDTAMAKREIDGLFGGQGVFEYPKPTKLIRRLIQISTRPGDVVMDFFAGSGTTGHAVLLQNAEDKASRKYIVVQLPEPLLTENVEQRVAMEFCENNERPHNISELTKERLRRAGAKVKADNPDWQGDTGFRVFKLDTSNIRAWNPKPDDLEATLFDHQDHLLEGRSEADVLYELLLKLGLDLCVPIEKRSIEGHDVHAVGGGVLLACLAEKITREQVESLAQGIIAWHKQLAPAGDTTCVFRDSAFADDVAKTNMAAILQQHGIATVRSL